MLLCLYAEVMERRYLVLRKLNLCVEIACCPCSPDESWDSFQQTTVTLRSGTKLVQKKMNGIRIDYWIIYFYKNNICFIHYCC